jgi:hypothetical protein
VLWKIPQIIWGCSPRGYFRRELLQGNFLSTWIRSWGRRVYGNQVSLCSKVYMPIHLSLSLLVPSTHGKLCLFVWANEADGCQIAKCTFSWPFREDPQVPSFGHSSHSANWETLLACLQWWFFSYVFQLNFLAYSNDSTGTIHIYRISRHLMTKGHSAKVE